MNTYTLGEDLGEQLVQKGARIRELTEQIKELDRQASELRRERQDLTLETHKIWRDLVGGISVWDE